MSYQFFNENEILGPEALSPNYLDVNLDTFSSSLNTFDSCYGLEPVNQFSPAQQFVYKAELTNSYLENGTLNYTDFYQAESKAMLNGWRSDLAFSSNNGLEIEGEAGNRIKQALLQDAYSDKGYVDWSDMYQADSQAYLQGPLQDYHFSTFDSNSLSCGEEFIKDSLLTESYLDNGAFSYSDVLEAELTAYTDSFSIDYLF